MDEHDFLEQLKKGDKKAFEALYRDVFPMVSNYIKNNSGNAKDAEDVFQEALLVLVKYIRQSDFKLTAKIGTLLYSIAQKLWLYQLRKNKKMPKTSMQESVPLSIHFENDAIVEKKTYELKHRIISRLFLTLKADCQKLLKANFFENKAQKDIAELMNYTVNFVKIKKRRCLNAFKKLIETHPEFKQFL